MISLDSGDDKSMNAQRLGRGARKQAKLAAKRQARKAVVIVNDEEGEREEREEGVMDKKKKKGKKGKKNELDDPMFGMRPEDMLTGT